MGRIILIDAQSGAAGDMLLGALLDLGVDQGALESGLRSIPIAGWTLRIERVLRGALAATKVRFLLEELGGREEGRDAARADPIPDARDRERVAETHAQMQGHGHPHHHGVHGHHHEHHQTHGEHDHHGHHPHGHGVASHLASHGRSPHEICDLIRSSALPMRVIDRAVAVFGLLAEAEAHVHGTTVDAVHFHEVGAKDAILDICGTLLALHLLGVDAVHCRSVTTGFGSVRCDHGILPVPAPATAELLRGVPIESGPVEAELLTPTGAALLRGCVGVFGAPPPFRCLAVGYGAGSADRALLPNVVRATLGEVVMDADRTPTSVSEVTFDVDDMSGQSLAFLHEELARAGALDVSFAAVTMKKGRPGVRVTLLAEPGRVDHIEPLIFRHSTTFGFRIRSTDRRVLDREVVVVGTPFGSCRVKVGRHRGFVVAVRPEYEDVAALARAAGVALADVERAARDAFRP